MGPRRTSLLSQNSHDARVKVVVRSRPLLPRETEKQVPVTSVMVIDEAAGRISAAGRVHTYGELNVVGGGGDRHADMYDRTAKPLIAQLFDGYNATVLAYGQTGSGKTHTMGMAFDLENFTADGIVPRAVRDIMARREELLAGGHACVVKLSACEIYNEEIRDLLRSQAERKAGLAIVEGANDSGVPTVRVAGLSEHEVVSAAEVSALLRGGTRYRTTAATNMNEHSSRSRTVHKSNFAALLAESGLHAINATPSRWRGGADL